MFGLFTFFYAFILLANCVVILNEKRFLRRVGLPLDSDSRKFLGMSRLKLVDLLRLTRTMLRIPLIVINIVCICYEMMFG